MIIFSLLVVCLFRYILFPVLNGYSLPLHVLFVFFFQSQYCCCFCCCCSHIFNQFLCFSRTTPTAVRTLRRYERTDISLSSSFNIIIFLIFYYVYFTQTCGKKTPGILLLYIFFQVKSNIFGPLKSFSHIFFSAYIM